ncbi:unnamed protein product [Durusdinium trenchii]|uniref:3-dehydroquinate synthase C-terminal domain-containing protein n=1 Tax=Durusdinium trenchii TaxID=1381693 RepID=A0ABP0QKW5_9DINO
MEIDFSQDFARWTAEVAASPLQLRGASASPSPSAFRPVELFASPEGSPSLHDDVLSGISEPREDAFVSSQASVRQLEYGKLERWIAAGGSVENFAPWFREMLMDQDEHALVSALRAVAQHYRSSAQQQALGVQKEGQVFVPPVPCYWLPTLAERLKGTTEKVAHEAAKLVAAVLLAAPTRTADRRAVGDGLQADAEHEFFRRFALLELRAKGQLLAACKDVLQPEDYQVMAQAVSDEQELQVVVEDAVHETPSSPSLTSPGSRPCRSDALWANEPKTWRQRVRCLEHLAEQREGEGLGGLWPQLLLQVEDDHPAVSAAAMHCLACLAPQMSPPREHLVSRLANALRQRLREPRCRLRNAALELLNAVSGQRQLQLVSMTLQMPKDRVRKALQEAKRSEGAGAGPGAGEMSQLEALLSEAFPSRSGLNTPSPARLAITAISPQKPTPSTRTPSSTPEEVLQAGRTCDATPPQTFLKGQISTPPRKVLSLDCGRGSGEKLDKLPSDSKLLSFEATPDQRASTKANVVSGEEEDFQVDRSQKEEITFKFADRAEVPGWLGVDVQSEVIGRILEVKPDRILLVTETVVDELHGDYFKPLMSGGSSGGSGDNFLGGELPPMNKFVLPGGDESKSWDYLSSELFSGLGELAKNAALLGGKHAEGFRKALSSDRINADAGGSGDEFTMDDKMLMELLALGIDAKMSVLADDAYEKNCGMIFEYGHTVSHAIEKAYGDGVIPHGLGVTYGMLSSRCGHKPELSGWMLSRRLWSGTSGVHRGRLGTAFLVPDDHTIWVPFVTGYNKDLHLARGWEVWMCIWFYDMLT